MQSFALGDFLSRWAGHARHDLSASESETLHLPELLAMAAPEDVRRWQELKLGYGDPRGAPWLRRTIAESYPTLGDNDVLCFAGAQDAIVSVTRALLTPDDHAVVVVPCYPPSEWAATSAASCTGVALDPDQGWALDLDRIARAIRPTTRAVLTNFPNNPTGAVMSPATLEGLVSLCRRHGLWLVNDEVYRLIDRDPTQRLPQVAEAYERGISINAISKSFGLPGLRVGWVACGDRDLLERIATVKNVFSSGMAVSSEVLAQVALRAADRVLARNRAIADGNLRLLCAFMARHTDLFEWQEPAGGVTGFPRYFGPEGAEAFAAELVRRAGVLVLPGLVWRSSLAELPDNRFRVGFGREGMAEALAAWDAFLAARRPVAGGWRSPELAHHDRSRAASQAGSH